MTMGGLTPYTLHQSNVSMPVVIQTTDIFTHMSTQLVIYVTFIEHFPYHIHFAHAKKEEEKKIAKIIKYYETDFNIPNLNL